MDSGGAKVDFNSGLVIFENLIGKSVMGGGNKSILFAGTGAELTHYLH